MNKIRSFVSILERNEGVVVLILAATIIIVGLCYSIYLGQTLLYAEENEYLSLSDNLVAKGIYSIDGVNPTAFRPPGYPLFLSALRYLGLNVVYMRLMNFILLAASMYLLTLILRQAAGPIAGVMAGLLVFLYPVLFYTAGTLYPQTFGSFLFISFIYLMVHRGIFSARRALLAGLVIGFLMLSIPTFILVFLAALLFLILRRRDFKASAVIILSSGLMLCAWTARNYLVFKAFIPFSTNSGLNLLLGNSPQTTPNSGFNVDLSAYDARASTLSETEKDAYYRSEALRFIRDNRGRALTLYLAKVLNYFNYRNEIATKAESSRARDLLMLITYVPLLALFILRLCLLRRYAPAPVETYFIALYLANAFFQAIFFTRIRFRLPFDLLLIGIVAIFLSNLVQGARRKGPVVAA